MLENLVLYHAPTKAGVIFSGCYYVTPLLSLAAMTKVSVLFGKIALTSARSRGGCSQKKCLRSGNRHPKLGKMAQ